MPHLPIGRSAIYYETHGEGAPVVLCHGVGGNHAIWHQQTAVLAHSHQIILVDHRGFGRSTDTEGLGRGAFAADLAQVLDHLGVRRAALIGQSMGAGVCIGLAARRPERVAALVVASSLHGLVEPPAVAAIMDRARSATAELSQAERVLGPAYRRENPAGERLYGAISSFNATTRRNLKGVWPELISSRALSELGFPILFIAGTEDALFPIEAVRLTQAQTPGSFLAEIDGAGHSAFFERPDAFNDSVLSFLQAAGLSARRRPAHSNAAGYVVPEHGA